MENQPNYSHNKAILLQKIAKLEAENEKLRDLLFIQWRFAQGYGESEDERTKELFNQWLKKKWSSDEV